jgi:hypothetical protein
MGVDVRGHVPIQDMPTGTHVKAEIRTVRWDGLEYYVLKSICPTEIRCHQAPPTENKLS